MRTDILILVLLSYFLDLDLGFENPSINHAASLRGQRTLGYSETLMEGFLVFLELVVVIKTQLCTKLGIVAISAFKYI